MSEDQLRQVFHVRSSDQVPEYELVTISHTAGHDASDEAAKRQLNLSLQAFGKRIKLNLSKNEDFQRRVEGLKMFTMSTTSRGGVEIRAADDSNSEERSSPVTPYVDEANNAALLLSRYPAGGFQVEGTVGHDLVIAPVPEGLRNETFYDEEEGTADDEMFLDEDDFQTTSSSVPTSPSKKPKKSKNPKKYLPGMEKKQKLKKYKSSKESKSVHFVYKRDPQGVHDAHSDFLSLDTLALSNNHTRTHRIRKRAAPDTVWPEVLLIVDYDTYALHGRSHAEIKRYFVSFWNGVDLRYRLLASPRVKISLAGMIVAKDRDATPYLERNRLRPPNEDAVDVAGALTDLGKYLYREDRLPTYDLAVVITKLDMCRRHYEGGRCNRGTAGFAYVGGACVVNKRLEKVNSVAIIEDSGGFSGIIVAAHEVGHLLGCVHDGSPPPSYLGGPGATSCPWEDGFIMSDLRHTERGFRWSTCSVQQFKHFLFGETASCLYNYPHENQLLARVLPGTMLSLDEQCRRDRGTSACFKDSRVCAQLFCFDSSSGYCVSYRPAAEGSPCGDGQVCKNGKCIQEIENIIPDYSQVSASVASPANRVESTRSSRRLDSSFETSSTKRTRGRSRTTTIPTTTVAAVADRRIDKVDSTEETECIDVVEKIADRMTCAEFLEHFGQRYCSHNYIRTNCCYTRSLMCTV
ncbi:A disintegrin and metalloproteinase with thrombospondin motifs 6 [Galendromus occidentalis]|uniref:A disintegrin and metalloproteinase with thrombospondin motifs 6 n=1 Tax=Galendromus occidentalis TaxID=34638 RepID=A0AAJ7SDJ9_9ACAR|nr:A disintegrin and metalloproteinase with thrombospondin motifs 6 [Galendromus occidentalis]